LKQLMQKQYTLCQMTQPVLKPCHSSEIPPHSYLANWRTSNFIKEQLTELFQKKTPDQTRLRLLYYASLLMAFFKNNRLASKGAALRTALGNISNPVFTGLISRYTEAQRTSAAQDANKRYTRF
jgi:A49-like RNA polymerase I associated factor